VRRRAACRSLGQLRTILPIDILKIDRSFVDGLGPDEVARLLAAPVDLAA
jgi:sensor c-di-GMP phosphodiesterase-like protein